MAGETLLTTEPLLSDPVAYITGTMDQGDAFCFYALTRAAFSAFAENSAWRHRRADSLDNDDGVSTGSGSDRVSAQRRSTSPKL